MIRASTKPSSLFVRADRTAMRPTLLIAGSLWITSAFSLFLLVVCCLHRVTLDVWPFLALATGFCFYQAVHVTRRYRRGQPLD